MEIIGLAFRSATSCCLPTGRLRSLTAASMPPFPPFGRRSLRFESALANIYCFKIKKTLFGKRAFIYMEIIGLAFRSATSCCLPTGRLRSLTAASLPPFPPFGRRSLRFESALANIYCFKIKKTLFGKRAFIYMEIIGLEPTTC